MDHHRSIIQFRYNPYHTDREDLSQECTAYLKTKQFMANRIYQQQEEIEMLKQNVIFHSGKHIQMHEMLKNISEQIDIIKPGVSNINSVKSDNANNNGLITSNFEDSHDLVVSGDITSSFVCEENSDNINSNSNQYNAYDVNIDNITNDIKFPRLQDKENISPNIPSQKLSPLNNARCENIELKKEMEKLKIQLLEQTLEINKVKTDKFILFNELNELIQSLRRVDLDKLNSFVKNNSTVKNLNKFDLPSAKGLKYNVLSAQCQLGKIIKSDLITKKLSRMEEDHLMREEDEFEREKNQKNFVNFDILQLETYLNLLKKTEEEFDTLLDRKLAKRSKSFNMC